MEEIESRVLTTCASPLRLRSGRSRGPRADHRQDDASEGSPTLISSLGREEGGGRVMQIEVPAVGLGLRPPTRPRGEAPTRGRRGPGDCWRFAAVGARGREDCSSRPSYRRAVANPAGCRCAPPGGGAPGRPRERGEGSRLRAGRPTRVELERGKLADCLHQPSRRRSVVVKQGVRTIEESRRGGRGSRAPYGSRAFQELSPSL